MARGIVRAADRVAVWRSAAEDDEWEQELKKQQFTPQPEPSSPPAGAEQKPAPNSNKFKTPANGLKKVLENDVDFMPAPKHQHPAVKAWTDSKPDFAKTYFKPHYQDALKGHLGEDNYNKLVHHMPEEHHKALTEHEQAQAPKSNKFTTPANGLKKLLDQPYTETSHVTDWLAKHPGFQKTYMSPKYTDALKGHLGEKGYNELQEHLKAAEKPAEGQHGGYTGPQPPPNALKPGQEGMLHTWMKENPGWKPPKHQNELYATPPKKPTKEGPTHYDNVVGALGQEYHTPEFQQWFYNHDKASQANLAMMPESALQWYQEDQAKDDDPAEISKVKQHQQKSEFHPALDELAQMQGTTWGDPWKNMAPDKVHDALKQWQQTFQGSQPEQAQAIQRVLDKYFPSGQPHVGDEVADILGPDQVSAQAWKKMPLENNKYALQDLMSQYTPGSDTHNALKEVYDKHFPANPGAQGTGLAPEDDPWHVPEKKSQQGLGDKLKQLYDENGKPNYVLDDAVDAWNNKHSQEKMLNEVLPNLKANDPQIADKLQRLFDEHYGDQDEIDQIKGQQPQKTFGEALYELFPDKISKEKALSYDEKTPEEQQKLTQATVNGQMGNHPEIWEGLNKLHNDYFGEDAFNPHPVKDQIAQQMAEDHGSNYNYEGWLDSLNNDELKEYKSSPQDAKEAFDNYMSDMGYDDYEDEFEDEFDPGVAKDALNESLSNYMGFHPEHSEWVDNLDDDDLQYYNENPSSASGAFEDYLKDIGYHDDDEDDEVGDDDQDFSDVDFNPHAFANDWLKAFPNHQYIDDTVTEQDAKNELQKWINESEDEALGNPDDRDHYDSKAEYEEHYDKWMEGKLKAQQLYDKYFGDGEFHEPQGGHDKALQIAKGIQALDPKTFDDDWVHAWADNYADQPEKQKGTLKNLIENDWSPEETEGYKALLQKHFGEGEQEDQGQGGLDTNALAEGIHAINPNFMLNKLKNFPPEDLKTLLEGQAKAHEGTFKGDQYQKLLDDHFGDQSGQPDLKSALTNVFYDGSNGSNKDHFYNLWTQKTPEQAKQDITNLATTGSMNATSGAVSPETQAKWKKVYDQLYGQQQGNAGLDALPGIIKKYFPGGDAVSSWMKEPDPQQSIKEHIQYLKNKGNLGTAEKFQKIYDEAFGQQDASKPPLQWVIDNFNPAFGGQALQDYIDKGGYADQWAEHQQSQPDLTDDEFGQWAQDFDNKGKQPVSEADQWQNLANGIDEIFPKNKLPMSSLSVDDLKQKLEGWIEHLSETPGHVDNVAKLKALYDQNFGDGDINAIKSQMPGGPDLQGLAVDLGNAFGGTAAASWMLKPDKIPEYLNGVALGGGEAGKKAKELQQKYFGDTPSTFNLDALNQGIKDIYGENAWQWDADDNPEDIKKELESEAWLKDPQDEPEKLKALQKLYDSQFGQQANQGYVNPFSAEELVNGADWGDQKSAPNSYPGASWAGVKSNQMGPYPSLLVDTHMGEHSFKPGVGAFLEAQGYGPEEFKELPWEADEDDPNSEYEYGHNQLDLAQMFDDLDPDQKAMYAEQEAEGQQQGTEKDIGGGNTGYHPLKDLQGAAPGSEGGKLFNSPGFPAFYKQYINEGGNPGILSTLNNYKKYLKDHPDDQDEISQIKQHMPQGDKSDPMDVLGKHIWDGHMPASTKVTWGNKSPEEMKQDITSLALDGHSNTIHQDITPDLQAKWKKVYDELYGNEQGGAAPDLMAEIAQSFPNMAQGTKNKWLKMSPEQQKAMLAQHASGKGISGGKMTSATTAKWKALYDKLYGDQAQSGGQFDPSSIIKGLQEALPAIYSDGAFLDALHGKGEKWHKSNLKALIQQGKDGEAFIPPDNLKELEALYQKHFDNGQQQEITPDNFDASEYAKEFAAIHDMDPDSISASQGNAGKIKNLTYDQAKEDLKFNMDYEGWKDTSKESKHQALWDKYFGDGKVSDPNKPPVSWMKEHFNFINNQQELDDWFNQFKDEPQTTWPGAVSKWQNDFYGDKDKHLQQSSGALTFDPEQFVKEYKEIYPSTMFAGMFADPVKAKDKLESLLAGHSGQSPGSPKHKKIQALYDKWFGDGTSQPSGPPQWDPQTFAEQYKAVLPGSSSSLASGSVTPEKAQEKLVNLIEAHPDSDKTPGLQKMLDEWFPNGEMPTVPGSTSNPAKKQQTMPSGSAHYKALMKNVMDKPQGMFSEADQETFRSKAFQDWFDAAPKAYRAMYQGNPGVVIEDFDAGSYGKPPGGGDWEDVPVPAGAGTYHDVSGYGYFPKKNQIPGQPRAMTHNPPPKGGEGIKFPRREDEQETLPLYPGEHFAPDYAPMPIYRLMSDISLDYNPDNVPDFVKQMPKRQRKLWTERQKSRLRRIDQIINGKDAKRDPNADHQAFMTWAENEAMDPQHVKDLEGFLFAGQQAFPPDEKWHQLVDWAKKENVPVEKLYSLAEMQSILAPMDEDPGGNYDHPELGQLLLDYLQDSRGGLGRHWTRDKDKLYEGISAAGQSKPRADKRSFSVMLHGLFSGRGGGTGTGHGEFDATDASELEQSMTSGADNPQGAGAPIHVYRLQVPDPKGDLHDLIDYGPMSMWPPGRNETASGKTVHDKPSLSHELKKVLPDNYDPDKWDKLTPGHQAEAAFYQLWKDNKEYFDAHPDRLKAYNKLWRDFFVGRPEIALKPHIRRASVQEHIPLIEARIDHLAKLTLPKAEDARELLDDLNGTLWGWKEMAKEHGLGKPNKRRQTPQEIEARIIQLEASM